MTAAISSVDMRAHSLLRSVAKRAAERCDRSGQERDTSEQRNQFRLAIGLRLDEKGSELRTDGRAAQLMSLRNIVQRSSLRQFYGEPSLCGRESEQVTKCHRVWLRARIEVEEYDDGGTVRTDRTGLIQEDRVPFFEGGGQPRHRTKWKSRPRPAHQDFDRCVELFRARLFRRAFPFKDRSARRTKLDQTSMTNDGLTAAHALECREEGASPLNRRTACPARSGRNGNV